MDLPIYAETPLAADGTAMTSVAGMLRTAVLLTGGVLLYTYMNGEVYGQKRYEILGQKFMKDKVQIPEIPKFGGRFSR